jgi:MFS transporter, MFS domain-containing protein family, molybdate-anion transporter
MQDFRILSVGIMQTCFEASMYLFVFLWSPVMELVAQNDDTLKRSEHSSVLIPFGIIFSTFMVYTMIGSLIFKELRERNVSFEYILFSLFIVSTISFIVPIFSQICTY